MPAVPNCESDRAQTPGARPREAAEGILPPPDPISESPAGASSPNSAADCDPAVEAVPPRPTPAGDTHAGKGAADGCELAALPAVPDDWHTRDAAGNYTEALGAIRAGIRERGEARFKTEAELLAALNPPAFLKREAVAR